MSPRSFWTIVLKTIGIYTLLQGLNAIPGIINFFSVLYTQSIEHDFGTSGAYALAYFLLLVGCFGLVLWLCFVKTNQVIDKLKLTKGIAEEKLSFDMRRADILKITIMVIGWITLIDSIPATCQELFLYLQKSAEYGAFRTGTTSNYMIFHILKTAVAIFMITSSQWIVNCIEKKRRRPVTVQEQE
jgi:hypothetical protein